MSGSVISLKPKSSRQRNSPIKASGGVASIEDWVTLMRTGATVVAMRRYLVEQLRELESTG